MNNKTSITIQTTVQLAVDEVWELWTLPEHITQWNFATDEWHCPSAENDLSPGGKFSWRMEARDGSMGFDFAGTYEKIVINESISGHLDDGRKISVEFAKGNNETTVTEIFETEDLNTIDQQRAGWLAILDNFKKYAESK